MPTESTYSALRSGTGAEFGRTSITENTVVRIALIALATVAIAFGIRFFSGRSRSSPTQAAILSIAEEAARRPDRAPARTSTIDELPSHRNHSLVAEEAGDLQTYSILARAVRPIRTLQGCPEYVGEPVPMRIGPAPNPKDAKIKQLIKSLGYGGCKLAMQLNDGQALIIPNEGGGPRWAHIVAREVIESELHQKIGLYSPLNTLVYVFPDATSDKCIPAYTNPSFADLATRGVYVIDCKRPDFHPHHPTLRLFKSHEDMLNMDLWRPLLVDMIQDIAKLVFYQIPYGWDCFSLAIIKEETGYRIRYFGFDFSDKGAQRDVLLPIIENFTLLRGPEIRTPAKCCEILKF